MRIRKLLLIYPGRSIRSLITKYVYAELSDIDIMEADTGRQALEQLAAQRFDIVACTDQLKDMELMDLKIQQRETPANKDTPFVVVSESESAHTRNDLVSRGFDHVVQIRVRPADLVYKINRLCDPRNWRRDPRYHIPSMDVTIRMQQHTMEAFLINISMGGILVELTTDLPHLLMQSGVEINLQILLAGGPFTIEGLKGKLLRLEMIKWTAGLAPSAMRATFMFEALSDASRSKLRELFQIAKADGLLAAAVRDCVSGSGPNCPQAAKIAAPLELRRRTNIP
jgi:CheY-like chemotaxis protein